MKTRKGLYFIRIIRAACGWIGEEEAKGKKTNYMIKIGQPGEKSLALWSREQLYFKMMLSSSTSCPGGHQLHTHWPLSRLLLHECAESKGGDPHPHHLKRTVRTLNEKDSNANSNRSRRLDTSITLVDSQGFSEHSLSFCAARTSGFYSGPRDRGDHRGWRATRAMT